ncbi:MAG: DUF4249 family protein [Mangrovibacterium sp.]
MKHRIIIVFCLAVSSCTTDIDLPFEASDDALVVNCLFSEDSDWNVILSRVKSYSEAEENYVADARVFVVPGNGDSIRLAYETDGVYTAASRPVKGVQYELVVKDRSKTIRAKSTIPSGVNITSLVFTDQHTIYYSSANLSNYDVAPLDVEIAPGAQPSFVRLRFYSLNTSEIISYVVTDQTIATLRAEQFPEDFLAELSTLIGQYIAPYDLQEEIRYNIMWKYDLTDYEQYTDTVFPAIEKVETGSRDDAYRSDLIFSNGSWLGNVSRDRFNVLGELDKPESASLFVSYYPAMNQQSYSFKPYQIEYWLEVVSMSEDYYKYQKSYINQVVNISNPFASSIEVYSNIENGVGIFAGYSRQMIHFYDF